MKLNRARVCMECDEVYEVQGDGCCPVCGGNGGNLALWLTTRPIRHLAHLPETSNSGAVGVPQ